MYKFTVRTTSALFMHGADNRDMAELRPPSIKGVMHYWYRAIAGAFYEPGVELRDKENNIFGSTDTGSRLTVRIHEKSKIIPGREFLLPHKPEKDKRSPSQAIKAGNTFDITLQSYPPGSPDPIEAVWALWVAINLGGFGQRARRGAGSLRLVSAQPALENMPDPKESFEDLEELADYLEKGLDGAWKVIGGGGKVRTIKEVEDYPILDFNCSRIFIRQVESISEEDARKKLMEQLRPFKNPVFGLPYRLPAKGENSVSGRMASPLHLHLVPLHKGFAAIQTVFMNGKQAEIKNNQDKLLDYLYDKRYEMIKVRL